ncbi:MAG: CoA transferase [Proteobacteria bacterium]|nr:CoA transferase [Pseudomonadota bacterium]
MPGPLSHIKAVEMTVAIQGPAAGLYLRDMGADVIKVEPPLGDMSRYHRGINNEFPDEALGSQFIAMNRGKKSVCLDIYTPLGQKAVKRLLEEADVFLSNFREPALQKMGVGYEDIKVLNPRLIYATVNGFGPLGPDADKSMLDGAAIARTGLASMTGMPGGGPIAPGATIADTTGAMQFALGIVTALASRAHTGKGQRVQTSALGAQLWLQMWELCHVWMTGKLLERSGPHHANLYAPYGIYETASGDYFLFAVAQTNEAWDAFWVFADDPIESINPKWDKPLKRFGQGATKQDAEEIQQKMATVFKRKTTQEWIEFLKGQPAIVYEKIQNYDEVKVDAQVLANNYIESLEIKHVGTTSVVGNLMTFSETPSSTNGGPPDLGADTESTLSELGFSADEIKSVIDHAEAERLIAMEEFGA